MTVSAKMTTDYSIDGALADAVRRAESADHGDAQAATQHQGGVK